MLQSSGIYSQLRKIFLVGLLTHSAIVLTQTADATQEISQSATSTVAKKGKKAVRHPVNKKLMVLKTRPLFKTAPPPDYKLAAHFVSWDPRISSEINFTRKASQIRSRTLKKLQADFQVQKRGSRQALQLGMSILKLLQEEAIYIEYIYAMGIKDPRFPDTRHFIRVQRSAVVNHTNALLRTHPKAPDREYWRSINLVSRLKIRDPSAQRDARKFISKGRGSIRSRVRIAGLVMDLTAGKSKSAYGTLYSALRLRTDEITKSVLLLYRAEELKAPSQARQAIAHYEKAAKSSINLRGRRGQLSPMTLRASSKLVSIALKQNSTTVDTELVSTLKSLGQVNKAFYYVEQVALNNLRTQPPRAMTYYADLSRIDKLPQKTNIDIEFRILDIANASNNYPMMESQWFRIGKMPRALRRSTTQRRAVITQTLLWRAVRKSPPKAVHVNRFVKLHDYFNKIFPSYAKKLDWDLRSIQALYNIRRYSDVAARADKLAAKSASNPKVRLEALRFSARSRESLLGIKQSPTFSGREKLRASAAVAKAYIRTLDAMSKTVKGAEGQRAVFQAAYVTWLMGQQQPAKKRFEVAIQKYPKNNLAKMSVGFLLLQATSKKDWAYTERIARLAEKFKVTPPNKQFANLRKVIENAVYAQANDLIKARKYRAAAKKFIAFQKEFPRSPNGATALFMAATAFLATNLVDDAVTQMEALLRIYPKSRHAKKVRWNAAEKSRAIGQLLRAAKHYEAYAKSYSKDGLKRKAWKLAGEMHLGLGRYASAITSYERYLAQTRSPRERIEMAKTLADLQFRYGKSTQAMAALDRVMKLSKSVDDEIWAQSMRIEILMRLGQERKARAVINRVLKLKPTTQEGFQTLAKAKFALALIEAELVRKRDPLREKNLLKGLQDIAAHYKKTGTMLLAPCEVPGLALCAEGYYQRARLAEDLAKMLPDIAPPPTLSPKEAKPVKDYISRQARLFAAEARGFALRAESALSTGSPSPDMAERIRSYARKFRGDEADEGGIE